MGELFAGVDEWGLEAVVRSCNNNGCLMATNKDDPESCFPTPFWFGKDGDDNLDELCFSTLIIPDLLETTTTSTTTSTSIFSNNELEELYKPFYSNFYPNNNSPQVPVATTTSISPVPTMEANRGAAAAAAAAAAAEEKLHQEKQIHVPARAVKCKRSRKNQQKKVVVQLTAEGLSSDMWAWRKYGQKPIKGSPYPRSYYRCSSSKGCLARKQVEQNCTDPGTFTVTYSAEHSHSQPTRRNSLAGTTRLKFPSRKSPTTSTTTSTEDLDNNNKEKIKPRSAPTMSAEPLSPTTPLMIKQDIKDEYDEQPQPQPQPQQQPMNTEERDGGDFLTLHDTMMMLSDDDFFVGLDGLLTNNDPDLAFDLWDEVGKQFPATLCSS